MSLTPLVLTDCRAYFAGADLTGFSNKIDVKAKIEDKKFTNFASGGWDEFKGGLFSTETKIEGFYQAADLSYPDDSFWANLGTNTQPLTVIPTSGAVGSLAYVTRVLECDYAPGGSDGELLGYSTGFKGNWPLARGSVLHPQGTARSTTGSGTAVQLGALSATQRLYSSLHILSVSGTTPSITVKIQSNVDNTFGAPTDRITYSAANSLAGQALSVNGAVTDTWWRATWTITGSTPSFLFAVAAGVASM